MGQLFHFLHFFEGIFVASFIWYYRHLIWALMESCLWESFKLTKKGVCGCARAQSWQTVLTPSGWSLEQELWRFMVRRWSFRSGTQPDRSAFGPSPGPTTGGLRGLSWSMTSPGTEGGGVMCHVDVVMTTTLCSGEAPTITSAAGWQMPGTWPILTQ